MRYLLTCFFVCSVAWGLAASAQDKPKPVSLFQLLAAPEKFDGKLVDADAAKSGSKGPSIPSLLGWDLCIDCLKENPLAALSNSQPTNQAVQNANQLWPVSGKPITDGANP